MRTRIVVFVYPDSVDVFRRIDRGHGRVEYRRVAAAVVRKDAKPWAGVWSTVVSAVSGFLGSLVG